MGRRTTCNKGLAGCSRYGKRTWVPFESEHPIPLGKIMVGRKTGPRTQEELLGLIQKEGRLHLHRVVATGNGYTRWFLVAVSQHRLCGTERCLFVHFPREAAS